MTDLLNCPFCGEDEFDLIGLKLHLMMGHCDAYNDTPTTDAPSSASLFGSGLRDACACSPTVAGDAPKGEGAKP